jgi:light-harvesting complex 1 beta chain
MASIVHPNTATPTQPKRDIRAFYFIFAVSFIVFLAIALIGETLGWHWRSWLPGAEGVKSLTGGVKAAVYTFMSYLS